MPPNAELRARSSPAVRSKALARSRSMPALASATEPDLDEDILVEADDGSRVRITASPSVGNLGSVGKDIYDFELEGESPIDLVAELRALHETASPSSPQSPRAYEASRPGAGQDEPTGLWQQPPRKEQVRFDTALIHEHVADTELFDGLTDERAASAVGILRDLLVASRFGAKGIFGVAHTTAAVCFGLGQKALDVQTNTLSSLGLGSVASLFGLVRSGVSCVHSITRQGLESSEAKLMRVFERGDDSLAQYGGEQGDLIRLIFKDGHYREAMLCIVRLLKRLGTGLEHQNPLVLAAGFRAMVRAQAIEKQDRIHRRQRDLQFSFIPLICKKRVRRWDLFMRFSAAAYGPSLLRILRAVPDETAPSVVTLSDGVEALTGVPRHDVIYHAEGTGAMYSPAHYVAIDHANETIVVVIRGTMHVADLLVDLVCEQVSFTCRTDEDSHGVLYDGRTVRDRRDAASEGGPGDAASSIDETSSFFEQDEDTDEDTDEDADAAGSSTSTRGFRGKAHRGFLIAARNLAVHLYDIVQDALDENPDYKLVVTGHSMGAGIATLLTLLWAQAEAFGARTSDMHAFAFGAPCSLCHELAQSAFTRQFVTAVVVGDDFVSRLSFSTVFEVQQAINAYASKGISLSVDEIRQVYRTIKRDAIENKLFSAGTVWLLDSDEFNMNPVEIDPRELLHSLEFSESFLTAHLPIRYLNAIANATTFVSPVSLQDVQILNSRPNPQDVS